MDAYRIRGVCDVALRLGVVLCMWYGLRLRCGSASGVCYRVNGCGWWVLTSSEACLGMLQTNWTAAENVPVKPKLIGTKTFIDFPIEDVVDYIDWNPFFQARAMPCLPT